MCVILVLGVPPAYALKKKRKQGSGSFGVRVAPVPIVETRHAVVSTIGTKALSIPHSGGAREEYY